MDFGAFVPQGWRLDLVDIVPEEQWAKMLDVALTIEAAGFQSLWVFDHFHTVPVATQEPTHEAWTLMSALAAATSTVRLGQMCTCNSYRSPAYLAKVAATVDVISGGRLEMGIGAGWYEHEYDGYGYEFPAASVRISMLSEAVEIITRMWAEDVVEFSGAHYRLGGAICAPKPIQAPAPPLWIAGEGERLMLRLVAEHADCANFGADLETFSHKKQVLERHCSEVGRDPAEITLSSNFNVVCAPTEAEVDAIIARAEARYRRFAPEAVAAQRADLFRKMAGTPSQLVDRLGDWVDAGLEYAIAYFPDPAYDTAGLELFAAEVAPAFR